MIIELLKKIDKKLTIQTLGKIVLILLALYLLSITSWVWGAWLETIIGILQPFIIGFILAFIIHPLIEWMEKKGVSKNLAIFLFWIAIIVVFVLLCLVLMPMLYNKISGFVSNLIQGIQWISTKIASYDQFEGFNLFKNVLKTMTDFLQTYDKWLPTVVQTVPSFMNTFLNLITSTLFTIIIAIYMLFDFNHIKANILKFFCSIYKGSDKYLVAIEKDVSVYINSLIILMVIKFIEYSIFYFLIGHEDWMIIAILMALGLLIPYIGGTIANVIGILTALTLPSFNLILLIVGICILSNVDAYVISPMVHEKRSSMGPLITLLAVFAGGVLYGGIGIMLSVPVAIAIRSIYEVYQEKRLESTPVES